MTPANVVLRYQSYCGTIVSEYLNWQVVVPLLALKHDYLLYGMLAMSALEISAHTQDDSPRAAQYLTIALQYQSAASSGLRQELANITPANRQALFALSSILLILGLAVPRFLLQRGEQGNMLDYMMTYLALLKGLSTIADTGTDYRKTEPLVCGFRAWAELPVGELGEELQCALQNLFALNEEARGRLGGNPDRTKLQVTSYYAANRRAIFCLRENFGRCRDPDTRSYCLGWPRQAGDEYVAALVDREPVALVTLMFWGVLLEEVSVGLWWAEGVGLRLIKDLCALVDFEGDRNLRTLVQWVRRQVGLDGLNGGIAGCPPTLEKMYHSY